MSAPELLDGLARRGVSLWRDGAALRYRGPRAVLTADVLAELKARKPELLSVLPMRPSEKMEEPRTCSETASDASRETVFDHEALVERAAILEHDAGLPREEADATALSATVPRSLSLAEAVGGRVWAVTFHDGAGCIVLTPEPLTQEQAESDLLRGPLGHRVARVDQHRGEAP